MERCCSYDKIIEIPEPALYGNYWISPKTYGIPRIRKPAISWMRDGLSHLLITTKHWGCRLSRLPKARRMPRLYSLQPQCYPRFPYGKGKNQIIPVYLKLWTVVSRVSDSSQPIVFRLNQSMIAVRHSR